MMQPENVSRRLRALPALCALLIAGCLSAPPPTWQSANQPAPVTAARPGDHAQAAAQDESLAAARPPAERAELQLAAAREWLAAGHGADAARVLAALSTPLSSAQNQERAMLDVEATLLVAGAPQAWQKINALPEPPPGPAAMRYDSLKMRIAFADARPVDGVRAEMAAERSVNSAVARTQLRSQLLAQLNSAREQGIRLDAQASTDPTVRGWLELGAMASQAHGVSVSGEADAARWRAKYPNHPAQELLAQALPQPLINARPGGRVALLLPLTGAAAAQAATVRDGFLSALYQLPAGNRPDVQIYDTGALTPADAIAQARAAGAACIVGPLTREDVAAVAALGSESVPVLALNYLPAEQRAPSGLYEYALSPENEARMVARRILADGHRHGFAMVPRGDWGNRVIDAFTHELTAGGGSLISQIQYDPAAHDYGDELRSVLRVSESEARHQRLQSVLGTKLNFEPRHRGDIDFVFIVPESATNARLIEPQLKFFYAGDIPSYSLSVAFEPDSTTDANRDIDGLIYPEMPWMLSGDATIDTVRSSVEQAWGNRIAWRGRLFAFGYDAAQLMLALSASGRDAGAVQIAGLTGQLHVDVNGRVQRDLIWVQVRDGEPKPLGSQSESP